LQPVRPACEFLAKINANKQDESAGKVQPNYWLKKYFAEGFDFQEFPNQDPASQIVYESLKAMADIYVMPIVNQKEASLNLLGKFHFTARDFGFLFKNIDIFNLIEELKIRNPSLDE